MFEENSDRPRRRPRVADVAPGRRSDRHLCEVRQAPRNWRPGGDGNPATGQSDDDGVLVCEWWQGIKQNLSGLGPVLVARCANREGPVPNHRSIPEKRQKTRMISKAFAVIAMTFLCPERPVTARRWMGFCPLNETAVAVLRDRCIRACKRDRTLTAINGSDSFLGPFRSDGKGAAQTLHGGSGHPEIAGDFGVVHAVSGHRAKRFAG